MKLRGAARNGASEIRNPKSETHNPKSLLAIILTLNEERHIAACIDSLAWVKQVLVFDSFSTDETIAVAHQHGALVIQHRFENYAQQRNAALAAAPPTEWVFFVDADERATPDLAAEIRQIIQAGPAVAGYYVPRHNYLFGHLTLGGGYYPDYQMRLLRAGHARYERPVEEVAVLDGPTAHLKNVLIHYNYDSLAQFHTKQRRRAALEVDALRRQGVHPRAYHLLSQPARHFWWRFVTLGGYRDGLHGLRLCALLSYYYGLLPYLYLWSRRGQVQV
ncbi:MAG: glycosyltransferase family 2 protein [Thermoflexales bacterium]|nr:glycosyltransferase family 2 protein [Thermoflexales bacterium]